MVSVAIKISSQNAERSFKVEYSNLRHPEEKSTPSYLLYLLTVVMCVFLCRNFWLLLE